MDWSRKPVRAHVAFVEVYGTEKMHRTHGSHTEQECVFNASLQAPGMLVSAYAPDSTVWMVRAWLALQQVHCENVLQKGSMSLG